MIEGRRPASARSARLAMVGVIKFAVVEDAAIRLGAGRWLAALLAALLRGDCSILALSISSPTLDFNCVVGMMRRQARELPASPPRPETPGLSIFALPGSAGRRIGLAACRRSRRLPRRRRRRARPAAKIMLAADSIIGAAAGLMLLTLFAIGNIFVGIRLIAAAEAAPAADDRRDFSLSAASFARRCRCARWRPVARPRLSTPQYYIIAGHACFKTMAWLRLPRHVAYARRCRHGVWLHATMILRLPAFDIHCDEAAPI